MLFSDIFLPCVLFLAAVPVNFGFKDARSLNIETSRPSVRWSVERNSTLRVEGASNINKFRCDIAGYVHRDTITCIRNGPANKPVQLRGSLKIDIFSFDCHSKLITRDLRKTLKAADHPKLIIRFLSLERMPVFNGNTDIVKGLVSVELAGTSRTFEILYSFIRSSSPYMIMNGGRTFNFSDFHLKPPTKVAGMVKIKDAFDVNFRLILNPVG